MPNSQNHKLRSIEVENFKSIRHAYIEFAPLTLVVGANSSGKSSLLQVILALSQAVRSGERTTHFPLNGEYAAFGNFGETLRISADDESAISIRIVVSDRHSRRYRRHSERTDDENVTSDPLLEWQVQLVGPADRLHGHALLHNLHLSSYEQIDEQQIKYAYRFRLAHLADSEPGDGNTEIPVIGSIYGPYDDHDRLVLTSGSVEMLEGDSTREYILDAVDLVGGLPQTCYKKTDFTAIVARMWWEWAEDALQSHRRSSGRSEAEILQKSGKEDLDGAAVDRTLNLITAVIEQIQTASTDDSTRLSRHHLTSRLQELLSEYFSDSKAETHITDSATVLGNLTQAQLIEHLYERINSSLTEPIEAFYPEGEENFFEFRWDMRNLEYYFGGRVKVLGPLREEPRTRYEPKQRQLDLGLSGEYTAAVLYSNSTKQILSFDEYGETKPAELIDAVNEWLAILGLVDAAHVEDQGRLGIRLDVTPVDSDHRVDLTSVGVGVSQILPVIVLCLLAAPGDLLVLQQPELHLHPALQQRLGDFFLACARSGRQLLVETHSEHLVNRVRRRVADPSGWAEGLVSLVFAEQEQGITDYRSSAVNSLGGVDDDWPSGFFDIASDEAQALVATSVAKQSQHID